MDVDRLARWYRWIEYAAFGRALERARFAFLDRLADARRVLVLGEGDGRALQQMLAIATEARFDVVEASAEMIGLARERVGDSERVRFFRQDALAGALPERGYDAVVTFFFLDCFTEGELRELLSRIAGRLAPGAIWLMSDFTTEAGWHARAWIWLMYRFFNITTGLRARALPPIEKLLSEIGMRRTNVQQRRWGMIVSEVLVHQPGGGVMLP